MYYITEDDLIVRHLFKYKINRYLHKPGPENVWEHIEILERPGYEITEIKHEPIPDDETIIKEMQMLVDSYHCKVFMRYTEVEELET